mgnify:CR=1 FL=1
MTTAAQVGQAGGASPLGTVSLVPEIALAPYAGQAQIGFNQGFSTFCPWVSLVQLPKGLLE